MIRFIVIIIFTVLFLILSIPLLLVEWIIGRFNSDVKDRSTMKILQCVFRFLVFLAGTKVDITGLENIPTDRSVLYIGNHRSFFDIIINYIYFPNPTGFVSKKELGKVPLLNIWMKNIHCLFLDRKNVKQGLETILAAIDLVKKGTSMFIFPEGTRNKENDEILPFKAGSFKIATKSGCDIIPISIVNTSAIFEDNFPKIKKAHVIIEYGKPIPTAGLPREELVALPGKSRDLIVEMYERNKSSLIPQNKKEV